MHEHLPGTSAINSRKLAVWGALITGMAGVLLAIYSVMTGEETGGAALLAASALAFGLLCLNLDRLINRPSHLSTSNIEDKPPAPVPDASSNSKANAHKQSNNDIQRAIKNSAPDMFEPKVNNDGVHAEPITERELQVLTLVAKGYSNKLIGSQLGISERTVKNHLTATMMKLRVSDRTHAVVTAMRMGWLVL